MRTTGAPRGTLDGRDLKSILNVALVALGGAAATAVEQQATGADYSDGMTVFSLLTNMIIAAVVARLATNRHRRFSVDLNDEYAIDNAIYELESLRQNPRYRAHSEQRPRRSAPPKDSVSPSNNSSPRGWGQ